MSLNQLNETLTEAQFTELVTQNQRGLLALAIRLCHNKMTAEDLVQDTLFKAWQKRTSFAPNTDFGGWCAKILLNKFRDQVRASKLRPAPLPLDRVPALVEASKVDGDIADGYVARESNLETRALAEKLLNSLPDSQRRIMVRKIFGGMTDAEIAKALSLTEGGVRSAIHRARIRLKTRLAHVG